MRVAFLIKRKNYYRVLGSVVEEALTRGWRVECWHDHGHSRTNWKGHEFPDHVPDFRAGAPAVVQFQGLSDLARRLEADPPDAVICVDPPERDAVPLTKAKWFWLQFAADMVLHPEAPGGLEDAAAVGVYSRWWTGQLERRFGRDAVGPHAQAKPVAVGMPMLDAARAIDPDRVRMKYGLPRSQPLVLYLPFPFRSSAPRPWVRRLGRVGERINRRLPPPRTDRRLVEALGAFCQRNGAALVVKSRLKDPSPAYLRRAATAHFDDEPYHPPVILELLRCASLCVHYYSTAVLESVFCGVPSLCVGPDPEAMGLDAHARLIHHGDEGGIYHWPGAAHWRSLAEARDGLARWSLADFAIEAEARRRYVEQFLGFDDARSSQRFVDLVAQNSLSPLGVVVECRQ